MQHSEPIPVNPSENVEDVVPLFHLSQVLKWNAGRIAETCGYRSFRSAVRQGPDGGAGVVGKQELRNPEAGILNSPDCGGATAMA
ncbi:hypothetical protein [Streptomyces hebeiensis]